MSQVQDEPRVWPTPAQSAVSHDETDLVPRTFPQSLVVLIQVPTLAPDRVVSIARKPSPAAFIRVNTIDSRSHKSGGRRRIRREIRTAGSILMMIAPLILAVLLLRSVAATAPSADGIRSRTTPVSLSIEPPSSALHEFECGPTIVFPGYLLPVDRGEEASHEGG